MIRGVMNSLWRIPSEKFGADGLFMYTFSGLWAPGPGFWVESVEEVSKWVLLSITVFIVFLLINDQ